jgi:RNA polymerase sigma factor (TIGR02999 family)
MIEPSPHDITDLLHSWNEGDPGALDKLTPLVFRELHRLAVRYVGRERVDHTLQPTGLVNEAYIRLIDWPNVEWKNREHFYGVSAQVMRHILVDYARTRLYSKRGGGARSVSLDDAPNLSDNNSLASLVDVDRALARLAALDPRTAQVIELRYFGGFTVEETARIMDLSSITVIRSWNFAKAWLLRELYGDVKP